MNKNIVGILSGAVFGFVSAWAYLGGPESTNVDDPVIIVRDIGNLPPMTEVEVAKHRAQRFESLTTIEETLRLRSDFDQTEALYVLAGRSDSAGVQDLIYQTIRVADASDRRAGLSILFARLTDIDPRSAVAIAGRAPFTAERSVEPSIWRTWARYDLEGALNAASTLSPLTRKVRAAESIYGAHGYIGNSITLQIEDALGVPPSKWIKSQYIQSLAADSPESAFEYLNELRPLSEQNNAALTLGDYFGQSSPGRAEGYASLISQKSARSVYESRVIDAIAKINPTMMLDRWMKDPDMRKYGAAISTAIAQLAYTDLEQAIRYVHATENRQMKQLMSHSITQALAANDPERALEWARDSSIGHDKSVYQQAIMLVSVSHPNVAMEAINDMPVGNERDSLTALVVSSIAQSDPVIALATVEQMPAGPGKQQAAQYLLMHWVRVDSQAAFSWAIDNTEVLGPQALRNVSNQLISQDPEAAMQMLPRLDKKTAGEWSVRIVRALANQQSPAAAEVFMSRYRDTPEYSQMQATLIPQVAQTDVVRAKSMADGMADGKDRDTVYVQLIGIVASRDPHQAASWLASVQDEHSRSQAVSSLVQSWSQADPASAARWVKNLPADKTRDSAISTLVNASQTFSESKVNLINSIVDDQTRSQTKIMYIYRMAQTDRNKAEAMLNSMQLDDAQRKQIEELLRQTRTQYNVSY